MRLPRHSPRHGFTLIELLVVIAIIGILVALLNAWALALLALNLGGASIADGILLGALAWLGFQATLKAAQVAFEGRSWNGWLIAGVHDLFIQVVMAAIVTAWR